MGIISFEGGSEKSRFGLDVSQGLVNIFKKNLIRSQGDHFQEKFDKFTRLQNHLISEHFQEKYDKFRAKSSPGYVWPYDLGFERKVHKAMYGLMIWVSSE